MVLGFQSNIIQRMALESLIFLLMNVIINNYFLLHKFHPKNLLLDVMLNFYWRVKKMY